ncbi:enoyl-CoA hydratase/isomerase [Geobacter metallireducens GS-15]|uniref:Enoyl-CoA hydratase/isomerase n=2 Tax=Geobacter metallireducens TaxID=28232 RepID=Q39TH3_GEOMG|nr:enoyl-CoA hydratase/isomerase [Geobacter metallireducens GS-15]
MGFQELLYEKTEGVGVITLNRPDRLNALNRTILLELIQVLQEATTDNEVRVVLITGAGKGFCAGGDLKGHPSFETSDPLVREGYVKESHQAILLLHHMPKPVVAAVNGVAAGAGMNIALSCDIRLASDTAVFTESFIKAGIMTDMGGSYFLPRIVGVGRAIEMILTAEKIDAAEACRIGLVNKVFPDAEFRTAALSYAKELAKGPRQAYKMAKWAIYTGLQLDLEDALKHEELGQALLIGTEDSSNAIKAFIEKRTPVFK